MQVDLTGRSALVTGASTGLGLATAQRLASSGANVAILARRADALKAAAETIRRKASGMVLPLACDVTDEAATKAAADAAIGSFGGLDILVNNAGGSSRGPVETLDRKEILKDLDVKLLAALALIRHVVPGMKQRRWGRILNTTAIVGKIPDAESMPTSLSRAAGIAMTRALSQELAPWNILVNTLCVGKIRSGQWDRRFAASGAESFEAFVRPVAETIPMGRIGEAEEFANVACFLASDLASYVTGAAINIDGGLCPVP